MALASGEKNAKKEKSLKEKRSFGQQIVPAISLDSSDALFQQNSANSFSQFQQPGFQQGQFSGFQQVGLPQVQVSGLSGLQQVQVSGLRQVEIPQVQSFGQQVSTGLDGQSFGQVSAGLGGQSYGQQQSFEQVSGSLGGLSESNFQNQQGIQSYGEYLKQHPLSSSGTFSNGYQFSGLQGVQVPQFKGIQSYSQGIYEVYDLFIHNINYIFF